jgi:two-component system KDP operon response regulator KdpE
VTDARFRVLIVEDDPDIRRVLRALLGSGQFKIVEAESASRALIEARSHRPDVVLLDLGLPDRDGQELIRAIRAFATVPILVLSARTMELEKIRAFDSGADDYITKPFNTGELLARVRAALRRSVRSADQSHRIQIGDVQLDLAARDARGPDGRPLHFTPLEYRLLGCLAGAHGLVVTREQLIKDVWGPGRMEDTRGLRAYIKALRQKIEPFPAHPRYLLTEPGLGYRLLTPGGESDASPEKGLS